MVREACHLLVFDARSETNIQAEVNFAREHNFKLVVKTTGT